MGAFVNIYKNDFGLGFYWKKDGVVLKDRIQVVFRDMGFYLTIDEITTFLDCVLKAKQAPRCESCPTQECCRSILLKTPTSTIDLAINSQELVSIEDLLNGIVFYVSVMDYVENVAFN